MYRRPRSRSYGTETAAAARTCAGASVPCSPSHLRRRYRRGRIQLREAVWVLTHETPNDQVQVGCLSRVVHSTRAIYFAITGPKDQYIRGPFTYLSLGEHSKQVVRMNRPLQGHAVREVAAFAVG